MDDQLYAKINGVIRHLANARDSSVAGNVYDAEEHLRFAAESLDLTRAYCEGLTDDSAPFASDVDKGTIRVLARISGETHEIADDARVEIASDGAFVWDTGGDQVFVDAEDLETFVRTNAEMDALADADPDRDPDGADVAPASERVDGNASRN